jgi:acetyl esterase/lipase
MLDLNTLYQERVVYSVPDMAGVGVRLDLTYRTLPDGEDLNLDVYYPAGYRPGEAGAERLPAVVLVHGEWPPHIIRHSKDLGVYVTWGQLLASSGVAAVNFNHRATERMTRVEDAASDIANLIGYVRFNAEELGINENRLCVWAFSAGVPLGMWAAMRGAPEYVRVIVAYYGAMDLEPVREVLESVPEDTVREFSALTYLREYGDRLLPTLIAKAGKDNPLLNESIDRYVEEARRLGARVELQEHPDGRHGFDTLNDDDRSREIIRRTLDFVRENV